MVSGPKIGCRRPEVVEALVGNTDCRNVILEFLLANVAVAPVNLDEKLERKDTELVDFTVEVTFIDLFAELSKRTEFTDKTVTDSSLK
jgi:hypothetical protein